MCPVTFLFWIEMLIDGKIKNNASKTHFIYLEQYCFECSTRVSGTGTEDFTLLDVFYLAKCYIFFDARVAPNLLKTNKQVAFNNQRVVAYKECRYR
jgi:hypothetical protein